MATQPLPLSTSGNFNKSIKINEVFFAVWTLIRNFAPEY